MGQPPPTVAASQVDCNGGCQPSGRARSRRSSTWSVRHGGEVTFCTPTRVGSLAHAAQHSLSGAARRRQAAQLPEALVGTIPRLLSGVRPRIKASNAFHPRTTLACWPHQLQEAATTAGTAPCLTATQQPGQCPTHQVCSFAPHNRLGKRAATCTGTASGQPWSHTDQQVVNRRVVEEAGVLMMQRGKQLRS